jgi:hypothetical protein
MRARQDSRGGLAAGLALLARDRGEVQVAFQLLIYPMIDDRNNTPASYAITDPRMWNRDSNLLGWKAYLGRDGGGADVSPYAAAARATFVLSTFATVSVEDTAKASSARLWFQLYVHPDRDFTRDMIQRAEVAGCRALLVTVDTPILGQRDREKRNKFQLPPGMERENLKALGVSATRAEHFKDGAMYNILDPTITWDTIGWIQSLTKLPIGVRPGSPPHH